MVKVILSNLNALNYGRGPEIDDGLLAIVGQDIAILQRRSDYSGVREIEVRDCVKGSPVSYIVRYKDGCVKNLSSNDMT